MDKIKGLWHERFDRKGKVENKCQMTMFREISGIPSQTWSSNSWPLYGERSHRILRKSYRQLTRHMASVLGLICRSITQKILGMVDLHLSGSDIAASSIVRRFMPIIQATDKGWGR